MQRERRIKMTRLEKLLKRLILLCEIDKEEALSEFAMLITRDLHHEFYWLLEGGYSGYTTAEAYNDLKEYLLGTATEDDDDE